MAELVVMLAKPLNMTEDQILTELPMARANHYITALAQSKGARVVWPDTYESPNETLAMVRALLPRIIRQDLAVG